MSRAATLLAAFDGNAQVAPAAPPMTLAEGYATAAEIADMRRARGETVVGRKIGFTNRGIWPIFKVDRPVWGWVWDSGLHDIPADGRLTLPARPALRLEPEIAFGMARTPEPDMTSAQLLACIDWVAHSVELVCSLYPDWQFAVSDAAAGQGMHAALWLGDRVSARQFDAAVLERFSVSLSGPDGQWTGQASDVLGGPLHALWHLVAHVADMPGAPPIAAGEVITTGTLTDAVPVCAGQDWRTDLDGIALPGLRLLLT